VDEQDRVLARAALGSPEIALASWREWRASVPQEQATGLLVWAGGYVQRNLDRAGIADDYLAGIARHNFLANNRRFVAAIPRLRELAARWPITPLKSFAMSEESRMRTLRPLADFDFLVPSGSAREVADLMRSWGATPLLDVSEREFTERILARRGSWNFLEGAADLDLHWRYLEHLDAAESDRLVEEFTVPAESSFGPIRRLSTELLLVGVAAHQRVQFGGRFQGLFDVAELARSADPATVAMLASRTESGRDLAETLGMIQEVLGDDRNPGVDAVAAALAPAPLPEAFELPLLAERIPQRYREPAVTRHLLGYRIWIALGMPRLLERAILRLLRGFVRDAAVAEEIPRGGARLGPGWHYLYPERPARWSNVPEARAVFDDARGAVALRVELEPEWWEVAPLAAVRVVAGGHSLGILRRGETAGEFPLPRHGRRLEVALRVASRLRYRSPGTDAKWYRMLAPVRELALLGANEVAGANEAAGANEVAAAPGAAEAPEAPEAPASLGS